MDDVARAGPGMMDTIRIVRTFPVPFPPFSPFPIRPA